MTVCGRSDEAGDLVHPRPDHDDCRRRRERRQRLQEMADHRLAGDLVHDLGHRRFHARAAAGGEDDGGESGIGSSLARNATEEMQNDNRLLLMADNTQIVTKYSAARPAPEAAWPRILIVDADAVNKLLQSGAPARQF